MGLAYKLDGRKLGRIYMLYAQTVRKRLGRVYSLDESFPSYGYAVHSDLASFFTAQ